MEDNFSTAPTHNEVVCGNLSIAELHCLLVGEHIFVVISVLPELHCLLVGKYLYVLISVLPELHCPLVGGYFCVANSVFFEIQCLVVREYPMCGNFSVARSTLYLLEDACVC